MILIKLRCPNLHFYRLTLTHWASRKLAWASGILYEIYTRRVFWGKCSRKLVSHTDDSQVYFLVCEILQWCHMSVMVSQTHSNTTIHCPACRTTLVATRFRVAVIRPIIQVPHCIRVFFYFVWFVFINHIFQFYYELCTYCNILDIYLS